MKETKAEIMKDVKDCVSSKVVANNTVEYIKENGDKVIRLHQTDIVTFKKSGAIILNSGGWQTVTTKERINRYLPSPWVLYQTKNIWYLCQGYNGPRYVFQDGITLTQDKTGEYVNVLHQGEDERELIKLDKRIKKYADGFMKALISGKVPAPSGGDCWYCLMKDKDGKTVFNDKEHIISHMDEKYYVPSLLWNMMENGNISMIAKSNICHYMGMHEFGVYELDFINDQIKKALVKYVRRQLGMVS